MSAQWFWLALLIAALLWYSTVTVYVAIKGFKDIQQMLKRLTGNNHPS
jgi:hypothetical protein